MFEIGQLLTNDFEVSRNAVVIEIMSTWIDPDDEVVYYLIKCRGIARDSDNLKYTPWYYEDEVDLVSEAHLDKYYNLEK